MKAFLKDNIVKIEFEANDYKKIKDGTLYWIGDDELKVTISNDKNIIPRAVKPVHITLKIE